MAFDGATLEALHPIRLLGQKATEGQPVACQYKAGIPLLHGSDPAFWPDSGYFGVVVNPDGSLGATFNYTNTDLGTKIAANFASWVKANPTLENPCPNFTELASTYPAFYQRNYASQGAFRTGGNPNNSGIYEWPPAASLIAVVFVLIAVILTGAALVRRHIRTGKTITPGDMSTRVYGRFRLDLGNGRYREKLARLWGDEHDYLEANGWEMID